MLIRSGCWMMNIDSMGEQALLSPYAVRSLIFLMFKYMSYQCVYCPNKGIATQGDKLESK